MTKSNGKKSNYKKMYQIAKKVVEKNREVHQADTSAFLIVSNTATITHLSTIAQGDGVTNREGNTVKLLSIQLRASYVTTDATNIFRVILFRWKDRSTPTAAQVLNSSSNPLSTLNNNTSKMYHILYDKLIATDTYNPIRVTKKFLNYQKRPYTISFEGSGASDYSEGNIWMLVLSDSGSIGHPTMDYYMRLRFVDL